MAVSASAFGTALLVLAIAKPAAADPSELDPTVGYNYGEIETPRIAATGGAQRALSTSTGALFTNPANIAAGRVYHLGAFAQIWPEARRQSYGIAAADSVSSSSRIAGSAGATYNFQDTDGVDRRWTDLRFAVAYPFSDQFMFGLGGRYLWLQQNGMGPLGPSLASGGLEGEQIVRSFAFDAGATFKPVPEVALSLVGTNLTYPGHGFLPTTLGGGIGFGRKEFALEGDLVADFTSFGDTKVRAMAGAELLIAEHFGIRGGYRYDQGASSHGLALGFGYIDRAFIFDVAGRRTLGDQPATTIVLGFTYHLETSGMLPSASDTF